MKRYFTLRKFPHLEPHHQNVFYYHTQTLLFELLLLLRRGIQSAYPHPRRHSFVFVFCFILFLFFSTAVNLVKSTWCHNSISRQQQNCTIHTGRTLYPRTNHYCEERLLIWVGCRLFGWLVGFYGISTFVGYLTPNPFLYK